jgi:hypothetical protein
MSLLCGAIRNGSRNKNGSPPKSQRTIAALLCFFQNVVSHVKVFCPEATEGSIHQEKEASANLFVQHV